MGMGLYTRPSLRLLYGVQYSNVHNAYSTNFASTQDYYAQSAPTTKDDTGIPSSHWRLRDGSEQQTA